MRFNDRRQEEVSIDLTPFIDVVFMLLLFFVVSTTFYKNVNILGIQLPKANSQKLERPEKMVEIGVNAQGEYAVNGIVVGNSTKLKSVLTSKMASESNLPVILAGDQQAPHQAIVSALEIAEQVGVQEVSIVALAHTNASK